MNEIEDLFHGIIEYKEGIKIEDVVVNKDYLLDVHNNTVYNKTIIDYYKKLRVEYGDCISLSSINNIEK